MSLPYALTARYHELFMDEPWRRLAPALTVAVGALGADDTIIDLGAGSGMGVLAVAGLTPARVVAVAPDPTMRSLLEGRLDAAPDLGHRVSIVDTPAPQCLAALPRPVSAIISAHMLGHLDSVVREQIYAWSAVALTPGGCIMLTSPTPPATEPTAPEPATRWLGTHRVNEQHSRDDNGWLTTYREFDGDQLVHEVSARQSWSPVERTEILTALDAAGLDIAYADDHAVVARKPDP